MQFKDLPRATLWRLAASGAIAWSSSCAAGWATDNPENAQQRFAVDNGECVGAAFQAVPLQPMPMLTPSPSGGSISTFNGTTSQGATFNGNVVTMIQPSVGGGPIGGTGLANGYMAAQQQQQQAAQARNQIFAGCMARRGWRWQR